MSALSGLCQSNSLQGALSPRLEPRLKTTYYLRSRSATHVEKSTLKGTDGKLNAVSATPVLSHAPIIVPGTAAVPDIDGVKACRIDDPECEACQ
jgi:ribonucleoside-diphosphate reductase alpha chain